MAPGVGVRGSLAYFYSYILDTFKVSLFVWHLTVSRPVEGVGGDYSYGSNMCICFVLLSVFVPVFVFVFVFCCVACLTVSRLGVGGVRGSVVTILMAAIPARSHTVSYTGQPPAHIWRHIYKRIIICGVVLYSPLTNCLVRRPFGFHG